MTLLAVSCTLCVVTFPTAGQAAFPGANGKIAFQTQRDRIGSTNIFEIYSINPDGTGPTNLTNHPANDEGSPAWSPDGQELAFESSRDGGSNIYVVDADGTGLRRLTFDGRWSVAPTWSPDGTKIAYQVEDGAWYDITVIDAADGSGATHLADNADSPAWSPDGQKIAFVRPECADPDCEEMREDLWVMNADGSGETLIRREAGEASWSPDGEKFALVTCTSACGLHTMNTDGTGATLLSTAATAAWSPDGKRIAFAYSNGIWTMKADGSDPVRVSNTADGDPDWQPLPVAPYAHPQSASPLSVSLVPLFRQCGTAGAPVNGRHSPPLNNSSCNPQPSSLVARVGPGSAGATQLTVIAGDSDATNGDQADVSITAQLTDVVRAAGGDYNPNASGADLTEVVRLRLTDRRNNYGGTSGTALDLDFSAPIDCVSTTGPEGASCAVATSADALMAGVIEEDRGTVAQLFRVRVYDSGANGVRENGLGDDRIFAHEGIYIP